MKPQLVLSLAFVGAGLLSSLPAQAANDYVAHEWGTFTSFQGADGTLLDWNGVQTSELPPFVYDRTRPGLGRVMPNPLALALTKSYFPALQRMETPVIYFYSEKAFSVDVTVQFPLGKITEWFPQARDLGPSTPAPSPILVALDNGANRVGLHPDPSLAARFGEQPITNSLIRWRDVEVLPVRHQPDLSQKLPMANKSNHYFAARETEAAFVRVASMENTNPAPELEKFLFYRGVGSFPTPLKATINPQDEITIANAGGVPLKHLFVLSVSGERATFMPLGKLDPAQASGARLDRSGKSQPIAAAVAELSRQMADALVSEGLYRAEAEAMVKTWRDAWFEEQGTRILYVLPRTWTDQILPIAFDPAPRELVRVMVGRAELLTPGQEAELCECITQFGRPDPDRKQEAVRQLQGMGLGRFTGMALTFAVRNSKDQEVRKSAVDLLQAFQVSPATANVPATPQAARRPAANGG